MAKMNCPSKGERDLALQYLAGELPESEAEAFEKHYFECESCSEDVRRGSELRATYGKPAVEPMVPATRQARTWLPLAAAAAIAFLGIGVWQLTRRAAEDVGRPVMRSASTDVLDLKVAAGPQGSIELTWPSHPDAATYLVQVLASDDSSVWKAQTSAPRLTIGSGGLPVSEGQKGLSVEVEAFDAMGQSVAKSELIALPKR
jgi:hypothetical protein